MDRPASHLHSGFTFLDGTPTPKMSLNTNIDVLLVGGLGCQLHLCLLPGLISTWAV